jgi:hypothetical protein
MANTLKIKRSSTASAVPTGLQAGELAANTTDKTLFIGDGTNTQELTRRAASSNSGASTRIQLSSSTGALTDSSALTFDSSVSTLTAGFLQVTNDATNTTVARTGNSSRQLNLMQANGGKVMIGDGLSQRDGIRLVVDEVNLRVACEGIDFTAEGGIRAPQISLWDANQSHSVTLSAATEITSNFFLTLPATAGSNGQVLTTNGTGTLSWSTPSGSGSVPDFLLFNAGII